MARALGLVFFFLAITSVVYAARSNICLANTGTSKPYKPLQLYPNDCPTNASNCMAAVYNYSAAAYMYKGPKTLYPKVKESWVYMTQDESDNFDIVVITATSYNNNNITTLVEMDGAQPGVDTIVRDDPTEDQWFWNPTTNSGRFQWILQPGYTDGVVLGHIKVVSDFCFRVEFKPNWGGAISTVVFLSGNVTNPTRVISQKLTTTSAFFEFCEYPKAIVTKNDASCSELGSATAMSLNGTATYLWTDSTGATIATTSSVTGLAAGTYNVRVTVNGCSAYRPVTIGITGDPISATYAVTDPTKTQAGKIVLTVSGGVPPYAITWKNSAGTVLARNVTTFPVTAAGTYTVFITDGCASASYDITVSAPGACPAGTMVDADDCVPCPAGTYSSGPDSATCTVCPPGTWSTATNATSCNTCAANTESGGATGPCTPCDVSTYSAAGSGVCTPCPLGQQRASGATSCSDCAPGTFRCDDKTLCQTCPAGTFSAGGAQSCEYCDPGTSASSGQSSCSTCAANKYAPMGSSVCTACPTGTTAPAGSSVLLACM